MKLLMLVEERFHLPHRGLALVPVLPPETFHYRKGGLRMRILLRRPGGSETVTPAKFYLDHFSPIGYRWVCFPHGLKKDEIPIGTEVWLVEPADCLIAD